MILRYYPEWKNQCVLWQKWQMVKVFFMSPFLVNWDISPQVTFLGLQSSLLRARGDPPGDPALVCVFAKKWSHPHLACQVSHLQRDLCPISWVSRMDHPSVDTMFNYHILWEWHKNSHFHIKIQEDRKKWFASRSIILYPWNSRSQKLKKDLKIVMKLSLCQRDTLQHFLGATRQDGLVSAFVWPTRV